MIHKNYLVYSMIAVMLVTLSSCEVVGGIFKAGVWTGLLIVAAVIALVIWLVTKARK